MSKALKKELSAKGIDHQNKLFGRALVDIYPGEPLYVDYHWNLRAWQIYTNRTTIPSLSGLYQIRNQIQWRESFTMYNYEPHNWYKTITQHGKGLISRFYSPIASYTSDESYEDNDQSSDIDFAL